MVPRTTIEHVKQELLEEAGLSPSGYYLRWNKRVLENKYSMEDYGFVRDGKEVTFESSRS